MWIIGLIELLNFTGLGITVSAATGTELILVAIINFLIGALFISNMEIRQYLSDWSDEYIIAQKEDGVSDIDFIEHSFLKDKYKAYNGILIYPKNQKIPY